MLPELFLPKWRRFRAISQMAKRRVRLAPDQCAFIERVKRGLRNKVLDLYLPVDVYISGCMPRPEALIAGFDYLMQDIKAGRANGWHHYLENLAWYRKNQKKVLTDWDLPDYSW